MKKKPTGNPKDDLRPEYDLRGLLPRGVRGKYASRYHAGSNIAVLSPDVARAFPDSRSVNVALRLVLRMSKLPRTKGRKAARA